MKGTDDQTRRNRGTKYGSAGNQRIRQSGAQQWSEHQKPTTTLNLQSREVIETKISHCGQTKAGSWAVKAIRASLLNSKYSFNNHSCMWMLFCIFTSLFYVSVQRQKGRFTIFGCTDKHFPFVWISSVRVYTYCWVWAILCWVQILSFQRAILCL